MVFLISMGIAIMFILVCREMLRKHPVPCYVAAVLLAAAVVLVTWRNISLPGVVGTWLWPVLSHGGLGGAFFVIVMATGAFPNGSRPIKWLMPVRGQLSILASILTLGHNVAYGKTYFVRLFTQPDALPLNQLLATLCSLAMLAVMLPLFATSFMTVRKRMKPKSWKKLQRWAYLFYALLCVHIFLLTVPGAAAGRSGYGLTVFVYGAVFASYGVCRILKAWSGRKRDTSALVHRQKVSVACCSALALLFASCLSAGLLSHPANTTGESAGSPIADSAEGSADMPVDDSAEGTAGTSVVNRMEGAAGSSVADRSKESSNLLAQNAEDSASSGIYRDGIFSGSGMGMNAEITVSVTIEADVIVDSSDD